MTNFNTLEELRTKEELVNYFAQRGQSITEEEIDQLKKSYEQARKATGALSLEQLDKVSGGGITVNVTYIHATESQLLISVTSETQKKRVIQQVIGDLLFEVECNHSTRYAFFYKDENNINHILNASFDDPYYTIFKKALTFVDSYKDDFIFANGTMNVFGTLKGGSPSVDQLVFYQNFNQTADMEM